jgi:hypothetical protein
VLPWGVAQYARSGASRGDGVALRSDHFFQPLAESYHQVVDDALFQVRELLEALVAPRPPRNVFLTVINLPTQFNGISKAFKAFRSEELLE